MREADCERRVNNVPVCPRCEGLCSDVLKMEEDQALEKQRARTMKDDVGFIAAYPFTDRAAYIMLAFFTWFFSFFSGFAMGMILSKGVLVWYSFTALTKVAAGKFRGYMPNFVDITDIVHPLRLSLAAFLAASWPLIVLPFVAGPPEPPSLMESRSAGDAVAHAQEAAEPVFEEDESGAAEDASGRIAASSSSVAGTGSASARARPRGVGRQKRAGRAKAKSSSRS